MQNSVLIKRVVITLVIAVWAGATGWLGWSYYQTQQNIQKNDAKTVVNKLKTLMEVPTEEPLVATITDADKLKENEPFYRNAQNGDKVVIWKEKAVIYRMEQNKIIDFGVVIRQPQVAGAQSENGQNTTQQQDGQQPTPTPASR